MSRQIDALIAEHVFGCKDIVITESWRKTKQGSTERYDEYNNEIHYFDKKGRHLVPHYSTQIQDAWLVRDEMAKKPFSKRKAFTDACQELLSQDLSCENLIHHSEVLMLITPEIICLAALKALGVDKSYFTPRSTEDGGGE